MNESTFQWLPTFPPVALRILEIFSNDEVAISELSEAIKVDPVLTANILKVANSPVYRAGKEIASLEHAISWLGRSEVVGISLGYKLADFSTQDERTRNQLNLFWRQSFIQGQAMCRIAEVCPSINKGQAGIAGLLMDIGQLLLLDSYPEGYIKTIEKAHESGRHLHQMEEQVLGMTHAEIGQKMMMNMGLPELFADVALHHTNSLNELPSVQQNQHHHFINASVAAAAVGDFFCRDAQADSLAIVHRVCTEYLQFQDHDLRWLFKSVQEDIDAKADMFSVEIADLPSASKLLGRANEQTWNMPQLLQNIKDAPCNQLSAQNQRLHALITGLEESMCRDALTDLYNREYFYGRLEQKILHALIEEAPIAFLAIDIDGLNSINESHGKSMGDKTIKTIADDLADFFDQRAIVARSADDEFVVLLENNDLSALQSIADQLCRDIAASNRESAGLHHPVTISIGGVLCALDSSLPLVNDQIVNLADRAMDESRKAGGNRATMIKWDPEHASTTDSRHAGVGFADGGDRCSLSEPLSTPNQFSAEC